ncbi:rRNA maturation RNase YbeY [Pelagibacteraceae bacterium]|nr:rRNA maturation RNase YbeY [Pelagibacteraceae bacterium]|tara:strand:- start:6831 stop:7301 length:471 start_codon:yes stop_codon:yes gene_type:complete
MTIKVDVLINNKFWKKNISKPDIYIKNKLKKAAKKNKIFKKNKLNFTLLLSGSSEIKKLNKKFRNKNKITDILSFPFYEKNMLYKILNNKQANIYLGDIIINLDKIIKNSKKENFTVEFDKIWVHGLVHLLGYRHKSNRDFFIMQKLENEIIESIQ